MYKTLCRIVCGTTFLLVASCSRPASKNVSAPSPPQPAEIDPQTITAWTARGFKAGWIGGQKKTGLPAWLTFESDRKLVADPFPTFDLPSTVDFQKNGGLKDLPVVTVPFGVRLVPRTVMDPITDDVVKELAGQPNLVWLDLDNGTFTKVTDAVVQNLIGLKNLNYLALPRQALTDRSLGTLAAAGRLYSLREADIYQVRRPTRNEEVVRFSMGFGTDQVTEESMKHLAAFTNLKRLYLKMTVDYKRAATEVLPGQLPRLPRGSKRLSDACLKHFAGLAQLEELDLTDMAITDLGAKDIALHTGLTHLNLDRTEVTDTALTDLARLPKLATLSIRGTDVTPAAVMAFRTVRPDCKVEN